MRAMMMSVAARKWIGVVPAKAGTHIQELVVMGPRVRGDDDSYVNRLTRFGYYWLSRGMLL